MKVWRSDDEKAQRYLTRLDSRISEVLSAATEERVHKVTEAVRRQGDKALASFVRKLDLRGLDAENFRLRGALDPDIAVDEEFATAVEHAIDNLKAFHEPQMPTGYSLQHSSGDLSIRVRPLDAVGIYVPGGNAVYISSLLMAAIPARVAGVGRIAVATPPRAFLSSPELRYVLDRLDLHEVYLMGGAHALAALAYGTESVTPVDKVVGPGGKWVAAAKRVLFGVVDVDLIAGPSEVVVIADAHAEPELVAADMLAQAEHDPDSLAVLLTTSPAVAATVNKKLASALRKTPREAPVRRALAQWGAIIVTESLREAAALASRIAPEHVELLVDEPRSLADQIDRAGAIYLGPWSPAVLGDYVVGTNHVLPTAGAARFASPLGVWDFVRRSAVVEVPAHRYPHLARSARTLATFEDLPWHAAALVAGSRGSR